MNRTDLLKNALNITRDRGENYGKPSENFQVIADMWSAYADKEFTVADVGVMMVLLKLARLKATPDHQDSWVDIAGYAAVTSEAVNAE